MNSVARKAYCTRSAGLCIILNCIHVLYKFKTLRDLVLRFAYSNGRESSTFRHSTIRY